MRKNLTLDDLKSGDILDPVPDICFKGPLIVFRKDDNNFYTKKLNKEKKHHKRILKYFTKRKIKKSEG